MTPENDAKILSRTRGGLDPPSNRRAPRISCDDVLRVADELVLEGLRPTLDRVRVRLGRGSPNTIQQHMDRWWVQLGARLRDVPGQEIPGLPEPVASALQGLWNQALASAGETLDQSLSVRERAVIERESQLEIRELKLLDQETAIAARATAQDQGISLAREQLAAANQRAERLEASLQARETDSARLQKKIDALEADVENLREKLELASSVSHRERIQLEERYSAAEARWLNEVDRARQMVKQHERNAKDWQAKVIQVQSQHEVSKKDALKVRAALRASTVAHSKLEKRLAALSRRSAKSKAKVRTKTLPANVSS